MAWCLTAILYNELENYMFKISAMCFQVAWFNALRPGDVYMPNEGVLFDMP